jgi:hypothetical protein
MGGDFTHDARNTSGGLQKSDVKDEGESLTPLLFGICIFKKFARACGRRRKGNFGAPAGRSGTKRPRLQAFLQSAPSAPLHAAIAKLRLPP